MQFVEVSFLESREQGRGGWIMDLGVRESNGIASVVTYLIKHLGRMLNFCSLLKEFPLSEIWFLSTMHSFKRRLYPYYGEGTVLDTADPVGKGQAVSLPSKT